MAVKAITAPNTVKTLARVMWSLAGAGRVAVDLSQIEAHGFVINGASEFDAAGFSVSAAGDVNGDGFDDLIVGAPDRRRERREFRR